MARKKIVKKVVTMAKEETNNHPKPVSTYCYDDINSDVEPKFNRHYRSDDYDGYSSAYDYGLDFSGSISIEDF